jgi:hypothetical protein
MLKQSLESLMTQILGLCLAFFGSVVVGNAFTLDQQQPPLTREVRGPASRLPPPQSLDEHVSQTSLIVLGEVIGGRQFFIGSPETIVTPMIEHEVKIIQVLKAGADVRPGTRIAVSQPGGVVVVGGKEIVYDDRNYPVFRAGEKLILLLNPDGRGLYAPSHSDAGVFKVAGGHVAVPSSARISDQRKKEFANSSTLPLGQFLQLLRGKVK